MSPHNSTSLWCYPGHISYLGPFQTHLGSLKSSVASAKISAVRNLSWAMDPTKNPDTFTNLLLFTLDSVFSSISVVLSSCVCTISQYQTFLSALFSPKLPSVWCPLCKDSYKVFNLHWVPSCPTLSICHSAQMLPDCKILSWCHRGPAPDSLSPLLSISLIIWEFYIMNLWKHSLLSLLRVISLSWPFQNGGREKNLNPIHLLTGAWPNSQWPTL